MKIEALIAIKSKGKKDIPAILSSMNIDSDARIAVYHYNGAKEEKLDYKGHSVCVHYIAAGTKMAAYNELLKLSNADVVFFAEVTDKFVQDYQSIIGPCFAKHPRCDGVLFGVEKDDLRIGIKMAKRYSFSALCMKISALQERRLAFIDVDDEAFDAGAIDVFRHEFVAWPSRCAGSSEVLSRNDGFLTRDEASDAFYDTFRIGAGWSLASLCRFFRRKHGSSLRAHFKKACAGHEAFLLGNYEKENEPIRKNPFPFVILLISMLGLAVQLSLSLLIVFTEVQYIPIWVALIFAIVFAAIYTFALPKVHNAKAVIANGLAIGAASFIGALVTYLCMGVSWAMSIYGAFICLVVVLGMVYCLAPSKVRKN